MGNMCPVGLSHPGTTPIQRIKSAAMTAKCLPIGMGAAAGVTEPDRIGGRIDGFGEPARGGIVIPVFFFF